MGDPSPEVGFGASSAFVGRKEPEMTSTGCAERGCPAGSWGQAAAHELVAGDGRYGPRVSG
jgi:hypothetical protein